MRTWFGPPLCDAGSVYCMFSELALSLGVARGPLLIRVRPSSSAAAAGCCAAPSSPTSRMDPSGNSMSLGGRLNCEPSPLFFGGLDPSSATGAGSFAAVVSVLLESAGLAAPPGVG